MASARAVEAAQEWNPMYAEGKQPFGPVPFPGLDALLRQHISTNGRVLDIGAGYGRDALWLARELGCAVTAVEPAQQGIDAMAAAARQGRAAPGSVEAVCCCASEFDFTRGGFQAVLMDSVLQFVSDEHKPAVLRGACDALAPGGVLLVIGWPNEKEPGWVGRLITEAGAQGVRMVVDADKVECDAELDGEAMHMTWAVSIARRDA